MLIIKQVLSEGTAYHRKTYKSLRTTYWRGPIPETAYRRGPHTRMFQKNVELVENKLKDSAPHKVLSMRSAFLRLYLSPFLFGQYWTAGDLGMLVYGDPHCLKTEILCDCFVTQIKYPRKINQIEQMTILPL